MSNEQNGGNNGGGLNSSPNVRQIIIELHQTGQINVKGFPSEYQAAMTDMINAMRAVQDFFMEKAVRGEFREQRIFRPGPIKIM